MNSSSFIPEEMDQVKVFYDFNHPQFYVDNDVKNIDNRHL